MDVGPLPNHPSQYPSPLLPIDSLAKAAWSLSSWNLEAQKMPLSWAASPAMQNYHIFCVLKAHCAHKVLLTQHVQYKKFSLRRCQVRRSEWKLLLVKECFMSLLNVPALVPIWCIGRYWTVEQGSMEEIWNICSPSLPAVKSAAMNRGCGSAVKSLPSRHRANILSSVFYPLGWIPIAT